MSSRRELAFWLVVQVIRVAAFLVALPIRPAEYALRTSLFNSGWIPSWREAYASLKIRYSTESIPLSPDSEKSILLQDQFLFITLRHVLHSLVPRLAELGGVWAYDYPRYDTLLVCRSPETLRTWNMHCQWLKLWDGRPAVAWECSCFCVRMLSMTAHILACMQGVS